MGSHSPRAQEGQQHRCLVLDGESIPQWDEEGIMQRLVAESKQGENAFHMVVVTPGPGKGRVRRA